MWMCLLRCSDSFLRFKLCTERVGEGNPISELETRVKCSFSVWEQGEENSARKLADDVAEQRQGASVVDAALSVAS